MPETQTQTETQAQTSKIEKRGRDGLVWVCLGLGTSGLGQWRGSDGSAWFSDMGQGSCADEEWMKKEK